MSSRGGQLRVMASRVLDHRYRTGRRLQLDADVICAPLPDPTLWRTSLAFPRIERRGGGSEAGTTSAHHRGAGDRLRCCLHPVAGFFSYPVSQIATVRSTTSTTGCRAAPPALVKRTRSLRVARPPHAISSAGSALEANGEPPHSARASASVRLPRWRPWRASRNGPCTVAVQAAAVLATCRCRQTLPTAVSTMVLTSMVAPSGCRGFGTACQTEHRAGRSSGHTRSGLSQTDVIHRGADNHSPLATVGRPSSRYSQRVETARCSSRPPVVWCTGAR